MEDFKDLFKEAETQVKKGAFLIAGDNPMTIGWCQFGIVWGIPVCTVFVRQSRYTHKMMEGNKCFTVSIPKSDDMKEELAFCGTKSGHDFNKLQELNLALLSPKTEGMQGGIRGCAMHFECETVFKTESDLKDMDPSILERYYGSNQATPDGDPHTVYFGKIINAYRE